MILLSSAPLSSLSKVCPVPQSLGLKSPLAISSHIKAACSFILVDIVGKGSTLPATGALEQKQPPMSLLGHLGDLQQVFLDGDGDPSSVEGPRFS